MARMASLNSKGRYRFEHMTSTVVLLLCMGLALQSSLTTAARSSPRSKGSRAVSVPVSRSDPNVDAFLVRYSIGTPPREFVGVADTGSHVVWAQCSPCVECLPAAVFETIESTSYRTLPCSNPLCSYLNTTSDTFCSPGGGSISDPCEYSLTYGQGSTNGNLASEVLTITSDGGQARTFPNFVFGCSENSTADVRFPIVGLSRGPLSLVGQLGPQVDNAFSFCFTSELDNKTTELVLGSSGKDGLKYTPLVPNPESYPLFYYVNLTGISVDATLVDIPTDAFSLQPDGSGGTILDTGTSFTKLVSEAYTPLRAALASKIKHAPANESIGSFDLCFNVIDQNATSTTDLAPGFPAITFHFQDLDLPLAFDNLYDVNQIDDETFLVCLAMNHVDSLGNVFGNYQMQDYYYFFDTDHNRVGISQENC